MTKQIEQALKQQNFDLATALYLEWYESSPLDFNIEGSQHSRVKATHIANAANLARRAGFNELQFVKDISPRLGEMVKVLFGLAQPSFSNRGCHILAKLYVRRGERRREGTLGWGVTSR